MTDFTSNFFDFDSTQTFLDLTSGALSSDEKSEDFYEDLRQSSSINSEHSNTEDSPEILETLRSDFTNHDFSISPSAIKKEHSDDDSTKSRKNSKSLKSAKKDKNSHNMIEKKYRTNINAKILALRDAVPSLRIATGSKDISIADLDGLTPASKLNKASVLTKATEYIKHLEQKNDVLRGQNYQLQTVINNANLNPMNFVQPNPLNQGFGFYPTENYNITYPQQPQQQFQQPIYTQPPPQMNIQTNQPPPQMNIQTNQPPPSSNSNINKVLLGGMGTVMAGSLFASNGNDFKGLSGLPISFLLPKFLTHPSSLMINLLILTKYLLFFATVFTLFSPYLKNLGKTDSKTETKVNDKVIRNWLFVTFGVMVPKVIKEEDTQNYIGAIYGGNVSTIELIKNYLALNSLSANFEICLLVIIYGKILIKKQPLLKFFINNNLMIKGNLILNMKYRGKNDSLKSLNDLITKVDGLSFFSDESFERIFNLSQNKPINTNITEGQNHLKFIEFFNKNNYYEVIVNWRIIEIVNTLNLKYLEFDEDENDLIVNDLKIIESILNKNTSIYYFFQLFKTVTNFNNAPELMKLHKKKVDYFLSKFELDDEVEDDRIEEEEGDKEVEMKIKKSLIKSLGLVNDEEFIVLASSLILFYYKNDEIEKSIKLLNYLKFKNKNISLITFSSLVNLIEIVPSVEDNEVLNEVILTIRKWLNENKFIDVETKSILTKMIVTKGMILNGIEVETDED